MIGEVAAHAIQSPPRSQSWKNKLQKHMRALKRPNGSEWNAENVPSTTSDTERFPFNSAARSTHMHSNHHPPLQSESLDSLTSASLFSRNSYPSVNSTGTDATSTSGIFTTCGITCSIDSQSVRLYKRMRNNSMVYLAHDDIEVPLDAVEQWESTDNERLKTDLSEAVMGIYRKGVERESRRPKSMLYPPPGCHEYDISIELRMSGRAARDSQHVAIGPSIWIICGSTWACKDMRAAMDEITWPTLPVEVHEGRVPIPSVAEGQIDISKLDLANGYHLGDGIMMYIHVESSPTGSASCGLLCCATIKEGDTYSHHFSRIGGLVMTTNTLTSSQFGVSTAHGILDHPWWHRQLQKNMPVVNWECQSIESTEDESEDNLDNDSLYDGEQIAYNEQQNTRDSYPYTPFPLDNKNPGEGYRDPQLVSQWRNVTCQGVFSFLGTSIATDRNLRHLVHSQDETGTQTDHAMIRLNWSLADESQTNKYSPGKGPLGESINITTHMSNDELTTGAVTIICQENSSLDARLLPGSTCLAMGGRMFTLRKLKAGAPLARGMSGSWVARGTKLCGMIIAVSTGEPYVYMMRAEDLISNLALSVPSVETVEVFNPHSKILRNDTDAMRPQGWPPSRPQRQLMAAIKSPRVLIEEHRPTSSIRRGFSTRLRNFGSSSRSHDTTKDEIHRQNDAQPHRKKAARGLLASVFSTKIEEIIQRADMDGTDTKRIPGAWQPSQGCDRIHGYQRGQAKTRFLAKKGRKLLIPLEPISEVSSVAMLEINGAPEPRYTSFESTAHMPITAFRHGPIRVNELGIVPGREPNVDKNWERPGYGAALEETARFWLSDNYENRWGREREAEEIADLVGWWESWGVEDADLVGEPPDEPPSPTSTTSESFPDISYSDTTSEDSISSCRALPGYQDLIAQGYFSKRCYEYESQEIEQPGASRLSDDGINELSIRVLGELSGDGKLKDDASELRGRRWIQGILA